jgi:hypothetical protein
MESTYGVVWREGESQIGRGKLELVASGIVLEGVLDSSPVKQELSYDQIAEIRMGRSERDRIGGRVSLVVERRRGEPVAIASVAEIGALSEIAERARRARAERGESDRRRTDA